MPIQRRTLLKGVVAGALGTFAATDLAAPALAKSTKSATGPRNIVTHRWRNATEFAQGTAAGIATSGDTLVIGSPVGTTTYTDPYHGTTGSYEYATWTSPLVSIGFSANEAIASWNATTPGSTWLQVELRGVTVLGNTTKWYVMGRWAADDATIDRTSLNGQGDTDGTVYTDTFSAATGHEITSYQLRLTLYRPVGSSDTPTLRSIGAVASQPPPAKYQNSTPQRGLGLTLDVPLYSQDIHTGQYPQWDGGGEAWCSPTSTSMVVAYWGTGPTPADYAWVDPSYADPWVDYAARNTYDYAYTGCGNWPFNTAYAGRFGLDGFVTRMRDFNEVGSFIEAGIPVVVSAAFKKNQIPGATYSTNGHLLVIVGFTSSGDAVMNDPAAPDDPSVRKVFGRTQFESAWQSSSGGTTYVIHSPNVALPPAPPQPNW